MKAARQDIILQILEKEKKIVASKLSERLKVSEDTIRRDLNELASQGLIRRV
ncbi:DeoR/GlpR transcriptional regulator, partial [Salmonella enterica]|nr:DeoR/GlpR transcriptional regulator [Salmonella enterica]